MQPQHQEVIKIVHQSHRAESEEGVLPKLYQYTYDALAGKTSDDVPPAFAVSVYKDDKGTTLACRAIHVVTGVFVSINILDKKECLTTGKLWSTEHNDPIRGTNGSKIW